MDIALQLCFKLCH